MACAVIGMIVNDNIPLIKVALKSILESIDSVKTWILGIKELVKNINNDKTRESSIRPIVIGNFRNLKFKYISAAEIVTKIEDISNMFIY